VDSHSAYEILNEKLNLAQQRTEEIKQMEAAAKTQKRSGKAPKEESWMDSPVVRQAGRTAAGILTRSLLGVLGLGGTTRRRKTRSLF
jgi:hypothetical protein